MKKLLWVVLFSALGGALWYTNGGLELYPKILEFLAPDNLKSWINQFGYFAPLVFMLLYYIVVLAFISAAAFTILSGILFGKFWGIIYVVIAATLAAQTAFLISRNLGSERIEVLKNKKGIGKLIKLLNEKCKKNGFRNLFILRCLFLPYIPLSYAAGMIKEAKPWDFFWATLLTNMIFSPAFVFFGDSLLKGPKALILPVILIVIILLVPKITGKLQKK